MRIWWQQTTWVVLVPIITHIPSFINVAHTELKIFDFFVISQSEQICKRGIKYTHSAMTDHMGIVLVPIIPLSTIFMNKPSLVSIRLQLFKWGHFHIFILSYNLTSDDLWPWHVTFDLINKWGSPCWINDPTLDEIHQSMWKIEPNVNPFFTTDNRQQWTKWSQCVFPAKAGDTKKNK